MASISQQPAAPTLFRLKADKSKCFALLLVAIVSAAEGSIVRGQAARSPGHEESAAGSKTITSAGPGGSQSSEGLRLLADSQAWSYLPRAQVGDHLHLPVWARLLVASLPHTTAAMLELDFLQRSQNPLAPKLRAELRWVAAHANRCKYSQSYAAADLRRLGADEATLQALAGDYPPNEREALAFARKLTLAADTITDAEVAWLIEHYGAKQVVAMVLLLAHANFQDRLLLALDLPAEPDGPLPPLEIRFTHQPKPARRPAYPAAPAENPSTPSANVVADKDWLSLNFSDLQDGLNRQRARQPRINLGDKAPGQINWGQVCRAYQPELAAAWSTCNYAFSVETDHDPVFESTLFWVIARSLHCFY